MQFLTGLVLGAILSVVVDRFWRRYYEQMPRFAGSLSYFRDTEGDGVRYTIENYSRVTIPDFEITLHHPQYGCLRIFDPAKSGDFSSTQRRDFTCYLNTNTHPGRFKQFLSVYFTRGVSELPSEEEFSSQMQLTLRICNSDTILFASDAAGASVGKLLHRTLSMPGEKTGELTFEEEKNLRFHPRFSLRHWKRRRAEEKQIRNIESQVGK